MGGVGDDRWEKGEAGKVLGKEPELDWSRSKGAANTVEGDTSSRPFYKSYFNSMKTHREHKHERDPSQMYDSDVVLSPECICTGKRFYI